MFGRDVVGAWRLGLVALITAGAVACTNRPEEVARKTDAAKAAAPLPAEVVARAKGSALVARANAFALDDHERRSLVVKLPKSARDSVELTARDSNVKIKSEGIADVGAELHDGALTYRDAFPDADVVLAAHGDRFEELRVLRSPKAPTVARYRLKVAGAKLREWRGTVEVVDSAQRVALRSLPAYAIDAKGTRRALAVKLDTSGAEPVLVVTLDPAGLSYPVVCDPSWVYGSTWANEAVVALNSLVQRENGVAVGDLSVTDIAPGQVLSDSSEGVIGPGATLTGTLTANRTFVRDGATVNGNVHTNTLTNNGTVTGSVVTPLGLPLSTTVPSFPTFDVGTTDVTLAQHEDRTLVAGAYGAVTLLAGSTGDPTVLTLSGGVYAVTTLNLGDRSRVECSAVCEIRIAGKLQPGATAYLGPSSGSGLSSADVQIFVAGVNGSTGNFGATPKAAEIGTDNTVNARIFAPNGTLLLKQNTVATGTFIGRDVDIGPGVHLTKDVSGSCGALDDGNPCTADSCDGTTVHHDPLPSGSSCSDGDACNGAETCNGTGSCQDGTPPQVDDGNACTTDACNPSTGVTHTPVANGTACDDGNACTQTDSCQSGTCTGSNPVTCTATDQCHTAGTCNPSTGTCTNPAKADGTACNDGSACTQSDTCQAGACVGSNPVVCTASDQCHDAGTCNPATGACTNPAKANGTSCSDGSACTQSDSCQSGTCVGSNPVTCTASDQCHQAGTCDPATGACSNPAKPNGSACSDGDACTQSDTCQSGACAGANPVTCAASDQCHNAGTCNPATGACSNPAKADGTTCSDGNACTTTDTCQGGSCVGSGAVTCVAMDQCHDVGTCNSSTGQCSNPSKANGTSCSDGDGCTQTDTCQSGSCVGSSPVSCSASDQCHTAGTCDPATGACSNPSKADGTACNDGSACTQSDACQSGACVGANRVTCTASDQCHAAGTCDPATGACSNPAKADGTTCNDGSACTQSDTCQSGTCTGANPVTCTASDQCHDAGTCDPATGQCSNPAKPNGVACSDGNACTQSDTCQSGACFGSNEVLCVALDQCHNPGTCDPVSGSCSNPAKTDGASCDDNNACTQGEACTGGACTGGAAVSVSDGNPCTADACDPAGGVTHTPVAAGTSCSDGNACNGAETCDGAATCQAGQPPTLDDGNPCTTDACDPTTGVTHTPLPAGAGCADANVCNGTETCDATGVCQAGTPLVVDDGNICTIDACDPIIGVSHTPIPNCDGAPTTSSGRFETRASLLGRMIDSGGVPVTGFSVSVFDAPITGPARADVVVTTAGDGSFRAKLSTFPETVPEHTPPSHVIVKVESPSFIPVMRDAYLRPGDALDLGRIVVLNRDPSVTTLGPAGGVATDSQGLVELTVPPGALSNAVPIQITPVPTREQFPFPLPSTTVTGYGIVLEPSGTQFAVPATLRVKNTRNFPTGIKIPVGVVDEAHGEWEHMGLAVWDGSRFRTTTNHFSYVDFNPAAEMQLVLVQHPGADPDGSGAGFCPASQVSYASGGLKEDVKLVGYERAGRHYGWTLSYASALAGSNSINAPDGSPEGAASPSGYAKTVRGRRIDRFCMPKGGNAPSGACVTDVGAIICGGALTNNLFQIYFDVGGRSTSVAGQAANNAQGFEVMGSASIPLNSDGTTAQPQYTPDQMAFQLNGALESAINLCFGSGGDFGSGTSPEAGQAGQGELGPVVSNDYTLQYQRRASAFGAGWALKEIDELFRRPDGGGFDLMRGDGTHEEFWPRVEASVVANIGVSFEQLAMARDPNTGSLMVARSNGTITQVDPNGAQTVVVGAISFPSGAATTPVGLSVAYVGAERRYLLALPQYVLEVSATGATQTLYARTTNKFSFYDRPSVAARDQHVYYATPDNSAIYHVRLDDPARQSVAITQPVDGHRGLDHFDLFADQVLIPDPRGLAVASDGGLYVASAADSAVYKILPDTTGIASDQSGVARILGSGADNAFSYNSVSKPALKIAVPQPLQLALAPDGTLIVADTVGALAYDPVETTARWLFFEPTVQNSDVNWSFSQSGTFSAIVADGPTAAYIANAGSILRVTADEIASELDPTRTVVATPTGAQVTDTTSDVVDSYDYLDATKQELVLVSRARRTGELVFTIAHNPGTSQITSVVDAAGGATTFAYDGSAKISSIVDPANRTTFLTVDGNGDLTAVQSPTGETRSFSYEAHRMAHAYDPLGNSSTYTYKPDGTIDTTTRAGGGTYQTAAAFSSQTYDSQGNLDYQGATTDDRGVTHSTVVDKYGQVIRDTYSADGVAYDVQQSYVDKLHGTTELLDRKNVLLRLAERRVNGLQVTTIPTYDDRGRVKQVDAPLNATTSGETIGTSEGPVFTYAWGQDGRLSSVEPFSTNVFWQIEHDANGRISRISDQLINAGGPTGRQSLFTWRSDGQPDTTTEHGVTTTFGYDPTTANVTSSTDSIGRLLQLGYEPNGSGNVTSVNDGTTIVTFGYDTSNRLTTTTDAEGHTTTLGYAQAGCGCASDNRVTSLITPDLQPGQAWGFGYDADGRLASVKDPLNHSESYVYTAQGDLGTFTDRNLHTTSFAYDQLGRPSSTQDPAGRTGTFAFPVPASSGWQGASVFAGSPDAQPAPTGLSQSLRDGEYQIGLREHRTGGYPAQVELYRDATFNLSFGRQFDLQQRLKVKRDRSGLSFDSGQVWQGTQQNFNQLTSYDLNTPLPILSSLESDSPTYYESSSFTNNSDFDLMGATGFAQAFPYAIESYTRDAAGRITGISTTIRTPDIVTAPAFSITYDPVNHRQLKQVVSGSGTQDFTYDSRGLVQSRTVSFQRTAGTATLGTFSYDYDAVGRNTLVTYPDGHHRVQVWDALGRLTSRCYDYPGAPTRCYTASYDNVGNPNVLTDPERSCNVAYDALDRLSSVTCSDGTSETYTYNALGALSTNASAVLDDKRARLDGTGLASAGLPATVGGQTVGLDSVGKVNSLRGATLGWDRVGRLTSITEAGVTHTYGHDSFFRRIADLGGSNGQELYAYEGPNVAAVFNASSVAGVTRRFLYDGVDHPLWMYDKTRDAGVYFELDTVGNVRRLRGGARYGAGAPLPSDLGGYKYTAFGKLLAADAGTPTPMADGAAFVQPFRWQGRWFSAVAGGVYDVRNRQWSPELGAFLSADEFEYFGPGGTLWSWPNQNPFASRDRYGRGDTGAAIGAGLGGFIGFVLGGQVGLVLGQAEGGALAAEGGPETALPSAFVGGEVEGVESAFAGGALGAVAGALVGSAIEDIWLAKGKGERGRTAKPEGSPKPLKHFKKDDAGRWWYRDPHTGKWTLKPKGWKPPEAVAIPWSEDSQKCE